MNTYIYIYICITPGFGALGAHLPTCLLLRRGVFFIDSGMNPSQAPLGLVDERSCRGPYIAASRTIFRGPLSGYS